MRKEVNRKKDTIKKIEASLFIIGTSLIIFIFTVYIKVYHQGIFEKVYYADHYIAGVLCPIYLWILLKTKITLSCAVYAFGCLVYELIQYVQRGYFQLLQFGTDLLGVISLLLIYRIFQHFKKYKSNAA